MAFDSTQTITGYGKTIAYSDTNNGTFTSIDGTIEITPPERELGEAEITHDASADRHREYIPGLFEPGECEFKAHYTKAGYAAMETIFLSRASKYWRIQLVDGSKIEFRGYLKKHNVEGMNLEDTVDVSGSIRVNGKATFTAAA